jgi:hypothetical protein
MFNTKEKKGRKGGMTGKKSIRPPPIPSPKKNAALT